MKRKIQFIIIISLIFCLQNLSASDQKGKLLFMGTKFIKLERNDAKDQFLAKIDKVIDSELFALRLVAYVEGKEKDLAIKAADKCSDSKCVHSSLKSSGISLLLESEVSFFPIPLKPKSPFLM